jgi:hypothetical protein
MILLNILINDFAWYSLLTYLKASNVMAALR